MEQVIGELINLIETKESTKLMRKIKENKYSFFPQNAKGDPETDFEARPTIEFRIEKNHFILTWLYLRNTGQGLGTEIFNWIIQFCKENNFETFEVKVVAKNKLEMNKLCKKKGLERSDNGENHYNYMLDFTLGKEPNASSA